MSDADKAVSVVVTCFNYGRYVASCLDSILAQSFKDLEIIVVDDGSTDDSASIVERYVERHGVRLIRQANGGQARAKNTGVAASQGAFVAFLDADDLWVPQKLERQIPLFADPDVGVVYSLTSYLDDQGRPVVLPRPPRYLRPRRGKITSFLYFDNFIPFSSSVIRRSILDERPPFDESLEMGIDWDLWLRLSLTQAFDYVDEPLLRYRVGHAGQMSKKLEVRQACSDRIMKRFVELNPDAISRRSQRHAWAYTHLLRGLYFREADPQRSRSHLVESIRNRPLQIWAYKELLRDRLALSRRGA